MLLTIVPLAVAQVVTLFAVMQTVESDVDARARESLVVGGELVTELDRVPGLEIGQTASRVDPQENHGDGDRRRGGDQEKNRVWNRAPRNVYPCYHR